MNFEIKKAYIVHYTKLKDRKENILKIFKDEDVILEFIEPYDREDINHKVLNKFYFPDKVSFEAKIAPLWGFGTGNENRFRILNMAEISCTIKHIEAIRRIAEGDEEVGLILEDDALPVSLNFLEDINKILKTSRDSWDAIYLGTGCGLFFINSKLDKGSEKISDELVKVSHPATNCGESYLITKNAAQKLYESVVPFNLVSDWEFAYHFYKLNMEIYWCLNPLFLQGSKNGLFASTLR